MNLLNSVPPTLHQAIANPHLQWSLLDTHRQVWVSLLWDHCSILLDHGEHKVGCTLKNDRMILFILKANK